MVLEGIEARADMGSGSYRSRHFIAIGKKGKEEMGTEQHSTAQQMIYGHSSSGGISSSGSAEGELGILFRFVLAIVTEAFLQLATQATVGIDLW